MKCVPRKSISTRSRTSKSPRKCPITRSISSNRRPADSSLRKFEDQYEAALVDLIKKRAGRPIAAKARPRGENVVDLMDALRKSVGAAEPAKGSKPPKKTRKAAAGQKEMLMPIEGKKVAKERLRGRQSRSANRPSNTASPASWCRCGRTLAIVRCWPASSNKASRLEGHRGIVD